MLLPFLKPLLAFQHLKIKLMLTALPSLVLSFSACPLLLQAQCALLNEISSSITPHLVFHVSLSLCCFVSLEIALFPDPHDKLLLKPKSQLRCLFLAESFREHPLSVFIVPGLYLYSPYFIYNNLFIPTSHFIVGSLRESALFYSALSLQH